MQFLMPVYQPKNDTRTAKQLENGFVEFLVGHVSWVSEAPLIQC